MYETEEPLKRICTSRSFVGEVYLWLVMDSETSAMWKKVIGAKSLPLCHRACHSGVLRLGWTRNRPERYGIPCREFNFEDYLYTT